jgi:hypothetical protein
MQGNGPTRRVNLAWLIETIQLDHLTAHALDSYLRHTIAIPLKSHVGFGTGSDWEMAVVPRWSIDKRS